MGKGYNHQCSPAPYYNDGDTNCSRIVAPPMRLIEGQIVIRNPRGNQFCVTRMKSATAPVSRAYYQMNLTDILNTN